MTLRLLRRVLFTSAIAILFVVCLQSVARAQNITVYQEQSLPRVDANGKSLSKRSITLTPEGVNYQDCLDDQRIQFSMSLDTFEGNGVLQMWAGLAGADCTVQQNRSGATATTCWKVVDDIPLQVNPSVLVPVRAIMMGAPPQSPSQPFNPADPSMCGQIDLTNISLQILYFSPGQLATPAAHHEVTIQVDTVGPDPPTGIRTLPGNGRITVQWDNISGEGGVSVLTGVRVYCDQIGGQGVTPPDASSDTSEPTEPTCVEVPNTPDANDDSGADAGTTLVCDDAGTSDGGSGGTCSGPNFSTSIIPDSKFNSQFECGSITGNVATGVVATSVHGKPLQNKTADDPDVRYAVAVAATDAFDNVGPLSTTYCEYPEPTRDFWESYRKAGGRAGGGCDASGSPIGSLSTLATVGLATLSAIRRRWFGGSPRSKRLNTGGHDGVDGR